MSAACNSSLGHTGHRDDLGDLGNGIEVDTICRREVQLEESAEKEIVGDRVGHGQTGIVTFVCEMAAIVSICHLPDRRTSRSRDRCASFAVS